MDLPFKHTLLTALVQKPEFTLTAWYKAEPLMHVEEWYQKSSFRVDEWYKVEFPLKRKEASETFYSRNQGIKKATEL